MSGVKIGSLHSEKNLNLYYTDIQITHPTAQTYYLSVPGRNGAIDLTEVNGPVAFNNGTLTFTFVRKDKSMNDWHDFVNLLLKELHGKKCKIILDSERGYYYVGRCSVATNKDNAIISTVTVTADCEPYKLDVQNRGALWEWDNLNFQTGKIYQSEYYQIAIDGTHELQIEYNGTMSITPVFICTNIEKLTVKFDGETYELSDGKNEIYEIVIDATSAKSLKFSGKGTVSISYRGGALM